MGLISQAVASAAVAATLVDSDADKTLVTEVVQETCEPLWGESRWNQLQSLHDAQRQLAQRDPSRERDLCPWVRLSWSAAGGQCHSEGHFADARTTYSKPKKYSAGSTIRTLTWRTVCVALALLSLT